MLVFGANYTRVHSGDTFSLFLSIFYISQRLTLWYFVFLYLIFLSQQVLYFLLSTLVLTLYIDVVLSLSTRGLTDTYRLFWYFCSHMVGVRILFVPGAGQHIIDDEEGGIHVKPGDILSLENSQQNDLHAIPWFIIKRVCRPCLSQWKGWMGFILLFVSSDVFISIYIMMQIVASKIYKWISHICV